MKIMIHTQLNSSKLHLILSAKHRLQCNSKTDIEITCSYNLDKSTIDAATVTIWY